MTDHGSAALIAPAQRGGFRRVQPAAVFEAAAAGTVRVEWHRNVPQSDFAAPGMTHHMLSVALQADTRMSFGWRSARHDARHDGPMRGGDLILLPAGRPSTCCWTGPFKEALIVYIAPSFLASLGEEDGHAGTDLVGRAWFRNETVWLLGQLLRDVAAGVPSGILGGAGRLLRDSLSTALGAALLQACGVSARLPPPVRGGLPPSVLRRVVEQIRAQVGEDVGLADLARTSGYSRQHFARAFKASTGFSPYQYVLARRIETAQAMLAEGTPIAAVSAACGFSDQSHFTRLFRQRTRLSPGAWQRRERCGPGPGRR